jgi:hypothetical protein
MGKASKKETAKKGAEFCVADRCGVSLGLIPPFEFNVGGAAVQSRFEGTNLRLCFDQFNDPKEGGIIHRWN